MLRLTRLEIEGFGPFAERQVVSFPNKPGVVIIYGENMRGKTTLLNAVRYAFFGKVYGRGRRERLIHGLSNRENATHGRYGFSVTLGFDLDGVAYELYRGHEPRVARPESDNDYRSEVLLRRGGTVLSEPERQRALAQAFPEEISRFFLFDGELLQEYEELIIAESEVGPKISEAIERILGVPILKAGRRHLAELADEADKQAATEASRHQETQGLGNALQNAITIREGHQTELARLKSTLAELHEAKAELEAKMATDRRAADLMARRQDALKRADDAVAEQAVRRAELKRAMASAWRTLLKAPVRAARGEALTIMESNLDALIADLRRVAAEQGYCDVCEQAVPPAVAARLKPTVADAAKPAQPVAAQTSALNSFDDTDVSGEVRQLVRRVEELQVEEQHSREDARELLAALADTDQATVRDTRATYTDVVRQLEVVKIGIDAQSVAVAQSETNVENLRRKLQNITSVDLAPLEARAKLLRESSAVFGDAVDEYKKQLRERVEASASTLFLAMSTEKTDYAGLRINQDYGLTIMHRDQHPEDARSAGAEHVVALALMGALQKNAPLRGPIVMDSPFGRLDDGHTSNVVRALHLMAEQVILLVYEAEVGRARARELLGSRLVAEYELEKINSRRTNIREVR